MDNKDIPLSRTMYDFAHKIFAREIFDFLLAEDMRRRNVKSGENLESCSNIVALKSLYKAIEIIELLARKHVDLAFELLQEKDNPAEALMDYSELLGNRILANGLNAENFLYFSVYIKLVADKFQQQAKTKRDFTSFMVLSKVCNDFSAFSGGWESLQEAADKVVKESAEGHCLSSHFLDIIKTEYFSPVEEMTTVNPPTPPES